MEIIKTENLKFIYPNQITAAVCDISLSLNEGEFITVCGKSGCGKSTLLRHFKPILSPHGTKTGSIFFEGRDITLLSQREQSEKIGFVMQSPDNQIVTDKVWHELAFGLESLSYSTGEIRARVAEMASFFGIQTWFHKKTSELSGGQKQLLNLASVMVMQPSLLILDEPTSQLDPIAAQDFLETLSKINREIGTTVVLTEHRLEDALPLSDRVIVMDDGKILADGTPQEIGEILRNTGNDMCAALPAPMRIHFAVPNREECPVTVRDGKLWFDKITKYTEISKDISYADNDGHNVGETVISLEDVWFRYEKNLPDVVKGLNLKVGKGEFYAILGGNGTGKTTALSLINSIHIPYRGNVNTIGNIAMLPQNPQVLFTGKTVDEDLSKMLGRKKFSKDEKMKKISEIVSVCELEELLDKHPYDLSGGEQQRTALAKVLLTEPDILLLDEPTKGLDAHFKEKLAGILSELTNNGITVVMVSHDIEFCAKYADRCGMFFDGNIVSEDSPRKFFSGKSFYTTAANRMARSVIPKAVLAEDVITALGGELSKINNGFKINNCLHRIKEEPLKEKSQKKLTLKRIVAGVIFALAFVLTGVVLLPKVEDYNAVILQIISIICAVGCCASFLPRKKIGITPKHRQNDGKLPKRTAAAALVILIAVPFTIYIGYSWFGDRKYYFISLLIILETILPFIFAFENRKPKVRELVIISVLCAIGVAGRAAFYMLPQFKPVAALVIICGVCFGGETGFLVGAITAFASSFFFGPGPWTPWQMFAFGMIGFLAGVLFSKGIIGKTKTSLCIFGGIASIVVYGGIMNPASVIMWQPNPTLEMILTSYIMGLPFDVVHGVSTVFFLWLISVPMIEKLERIKTKYGLID